MENYPITPAILLQWYRDYNKRYFDGELPEATLQNFCLRNYKHFGEFHHPKPVRGRMRPWMISETVYYVIDEQNRRHTLLHEMCHLWCYVKGFTNEHHGRRWKAIAAHVSRLSGFDIRRLHPGSFAVSEMGKERKAGTAQKKEKAYPILLVEVEEDKPASTEKDSGIYALITWPCSQEYIGHPDCFFYTSEANGESNPNLDQAVFVPETLLPGDERGEYAIVDWPESQTREDGIYGESWNEEEDEQEYLFAPVK